MSKSMHYPESPKVTFYAQYSCTEVTRMKTILTKQFKKFRFSLFCDFCGHLPFAKVSSDEASNGIIARNGRVLKAYMFIVWLYLFKKIHGVNDFFLFSF